MSHPATYQKMIATQTGRNFREVVQIIEVDFPVPGPQELVVKNLYAGVNASDLNVTAGVYFTKVQPPFDVGMESTGEVVAIGSEVKLFKVGDHVATLSLGGGYREYMTIDQRFAFPIPQASPETTSLIVSGLTAAIGLEVIGEMKSNEKVLVTAAAGATGSYAVQLAKLAGNHVIATCSSEEKAELLRQLGCDRVINYRQERLEEVLKAEYPRKLNLIYESVGAETFDICLEHLARFGRLVCCGFISEYASGPQEITAKRVYHTLIGRSASIRGFLYTDFPEHLPTKLQKLVGLMQSGKLKVQVDPQEFRGMPAIIDAVEYLHSGRSQGKVIVRF